MFEFFTNGFAIVNLMALDSLKRVFVGTVKISLATVFNYSFCLVLAASDRWLTLQDSFSLYTLSAGAAFFTMLLLGASGASASFLAFALQPTPFESTSTGLGLVLEIMLCVAVQYASIKLSILCFGLSSNLNGLTRKQLLLTTLIFSTAYTLSNYYLPRKGPQASLFESAIADMLGIFGFLLIIYLANKLHKFFLTGTQKTGPN
jgi:hypothetical protein